MPVACSGLGTHSTSHSRILALVPDSRSITCETLIGGREAYAAFTFAIKYSRWIWLSGRNQYCILCIIITRARIDYIQYFDRSIDVIQSISRKSDAFMLVVLCWGYDNDIDIESCS